MDEASRDLHAQKLGKQNPKGISNHNRYMNHLEGRTTKIRGKDGGSKLSYDQRDIDAAHILVELANDISHLRTDHLSSYRRPSYRRHEAVKLLDGKFSADVSADCIGLKADKLRGNDKIGKSDEGLHNPFSQDIHTERKQKKRKSKDGFAFSQEKKRRDNNIRENGQEEKDNLHEASGLLDDDLLIRNMVKKDPRYLKARESSMHKMKTKRRNAEADKDDDKHRPVRKKPRSQKAETVRHSSGSQKLNHCIERMAVDKSEVVAKSEKRKQSTLIKPNTHQDKGFSFSIIHLLSAVRVTLIDPYAESYTSTFSGNAVEAIEKQKQFKEIQSRNLEGVNAEHREKNNFPSLTVPQIVARLKSKPGDPRILETKEPLEDLVRGGLKILSSKTAPLEAKCWKALVTYEKTSKSWSWIGPASHNLSNDDNGIEVEISSESWGIPHRTLMKLVKCFGNWLNQGQERLRQIGSLPAAPVMFMQPIKMEERFKDSKYMRVVKSLGTISPSCNEVKNYFRKEEALRYLIPDRAFAYTALDGEKSTIAPLRKGSGKPSLKVRDHFMLKQDRPPHVTILCLVRDAAARLPGGIGTRADICTLLRDSQFLIENISDLQVHQVVSGALDRLHYERDPCVRFDKERHLWVYLHGEREDEDFEYDATSSRKKRTRGNEGNHSRSVQLETRMEYIGKTKSRDEHLDFPAKGHLIHAREFEETSA